MYKNQQYMPIFMRLETVAQYLDISQSSLRKLIKSGRFPKGKIVNGLNARVWLTEDVHKAALQLIGQGDDEDSITPAGDAIMGAINGQKANGQSAR